MAGTMRPLLRRGSKEIYGVWSSPSLRCVPTAIRVSSKGILNKMLAQIIADFPAFSFVMEHNKLKSKYIKVA